MVGVLTFELLQTKRIVLKLKMRSTGNAFLSYFIKYVKKEYRIYDTSQKL